MESTNGNSIGGTQMKCVYCAKCGAQLMLKKIGLPAYGKVIDLVPVHECGELQNPDFGEPSQVVEVQKGVDDEFVSKTNELRTHTVFDARLRDRREEQSEESISSTAPRSLIDKVLGRDLGNEDF